MNPPLTPNTSSLQQFSYNNNGSINNSNNSTVPTITSTAATTNSTMLGEHQGINNTGVHNNIVTGCYTEGIVGETFSDDLDYNIDGSALTLRTAGGTSTLNLANYQTHNNHNNLTTINNFASLNNNNTSRAGGSLVDNVSGSATTNTGQINSDYMAYMYIGNVLNQQQHQDFSMDDLEDADHDIINVRNMLWSRAHRNNTDDDTLDDLIDLDEDIIDVGLESDHLTATDARIAEGNEGYCGLRAHELMEAKDQLLVETSDMLHVPLFTSEALLREFGEYGGVMSH